MPLIPQQIYTHTPQPFGSVPGVPAYGAAGRWYCERYDRSQQSPLSKHAHISVEVKGPGWDIGPAGKAFQIPWGIAEAPCLPAWPCSTEDRSKNLHAAEWEFVQYQQDPAQVPSSQFIVKHMGFLLPYLSPGDNGNTLAANY